MLTIRGIEVTQAIQYYRSEQHLSDPDDREDDNAMRLIANKPAWVRVYVESTTATAIANVSGSLVVSYGVFNESFGGAPLTLAPQAPGKVTAEYAPDYATTRGSLAATLNFVIPEQRMKGPLVLRVAVSNDSGTETADETRNISATLRQTLKVKAIPIGYDGPDPNNPSVNLTVAAPGVAELQTTAGWALRIMPVRSAGVFQVTSALTRSVSLTGMPSNGSCTPSWYDLNDAVAQARIADGNDPGFFYYGLLAAGFPNQSGNSGCATSGVSSGFANDQITFTHEIGHNCGRGHGPCGGVGTSADPDYPAYEPYDTPAARVASIGEFGLDISSGAIPTPDTAHDYMGYCGNRWISLYGYQALLDNPALHPEYVGSHRPWWWRYFEAYDPWWRFRHYEPYPPEILDPETIRVQPWQKVIAVTGILHADDRVEVRHVSRTQVMSTEIRGQATELTLALQGAKNAELAAARLVALSSHGGCGCGCGGGCGNGEHGAPQRPAVFQAYLPDVAPGAALVIRRERKTLWKRRAPAGSFSVGTPKLAVLDDGKLRVRWSVRWPRAATRDIWLRVSGDEGRSWRAAAIGVSGSEARIDTSQFPAGPLLLDVLAHDGFRSVASRPVAFDNSRQAPVPAILNPHARQPLVEGETLHLWASIAGQPSERQEEWQYQWTIDGKPAGEGLQLYLEVPRAGKHRCEFSVLRGKGKVVARTQVEFTSLSAKDNRR